MLTVTLFTCTCTDYVHLNQHYLHARMDFDNYNVGLPLLIQRVYMQFEFAHKNNVRLNLTHVN